MNAKILQLNEIIISERREFDKFNNGFKDDLYVLYNKLFNKPPSIIHNSVRLEPNLYRFGISKDKHIDIFFGDKLHKDDFMFKLNNCLLPISTMRYYIIINETLFELRIDMIDENDKIKLLNFNYYSHSIDDLEKSITTLYELFNQHYEKKMTGKISYVYVRGYDLVTKELEIRDIYVDFKKHYNDNLPIDNIIRTINSNKSELILFYGKPGTGKTSLIRELVKITPNKEFLFFDAKFLIQLENSKVLDFLINKKDSILILEDCEAILANRETSGSNTFLQTLLNVTDGFLGDTLKQKIICTFNCPISKIDKAFLRKGRLSLKYEFKELTLEKTQALLPNATKPMVVADIFNPDENDFSKNETIKLGFK